MAIKAVIRIQKAQLTEDCRKDLDKNLMDRMTAAHKSQTKILADAQAKDASIKGPNDLVGIDKDHFTRLVTRMHELQLSRQIAYNTNFIAEAQDREIPILEDFLTRPALSALDRQRYTLQLKAYNYGRNCKKCHGHGYLGEKISTKEFTICTCVSKFFNVYKNL